MNSYLRLSFAALLPVFSSLLFFFAEKNKGFASLSYNKKQLIYGILFGILAIIGTEFGIPINGAQVNCRDGAVLVAGLMFGPEAGIIAGTIGALERWISVAWGIGSFTRVACTVSTFIAGIYSAVLRKYMFDNKRPGWLISFAIGIVIEIFHLAMVFITNLNSPNEAMSVVGACTAPMVIANGLSVLFSAICLTLLNKEKLIADKSDTEVSKTIQKWLLIIVIFAFFITMSFVFNLQNRVVSVQTDSVLTTSIKEVSDDINNILLTDLVPNKHVGQTGYLYILNEDFDLVSCSENASKDDIERQKSIIKTKSEDETFLITVDKNSSFARYEETNGYYVVALLPEQEAMQMRNISMYVNVYMEILVLAVVFGAIYSLINNIIVRNIRVINRSLKEISDGNLDQIIDVHSSQEFDQLSDSINKTVDTLKHYIDEAKARIDKELEVSRQIQISALPKELKGQQNFDICATMFTAKEVGGDFYDYYPLDNGNLTFLIADVSGKGIPAAMFMMRAKTELKDRAETGMELSSVVTEANNALCEGNDAGMFVTAWLGCLDSKTGIVSFINAGHNPPIIYHKDKGFEYLRTKASLVLGALPDIKYSSQTVKLEEGDIIFLYTDGVTEATDINDNLLGEEHLLEVLNSRKYSSMKEMCAFVKEEVDKFAGSAPQFDDITMVALRYSKGNLDLEDANPSDLQRILDWAQDILNDSSCPEKEKNQIAIALDEIFSNIMKYGYKDHHGQVSFRFILNEHSVSIEIKDRGIKYNPLEHEDPDIMLSLDDRSIGGLGLLMVKKTMTDVTYSYQEGYNILTLIKEF